MVKNENIVHSLSPKITEFLAEDGLFQNDSYNFSLPQNQVNCQLIFKSDMVVAGMPYFVEVFNYLQQGNNASKMDLSNLNSCEGRKIQKENHFTLNFSLPFGVVLNGERVALNLLQRACAVATLTHQFVEKSKKYNIAILDTRKTTPGLRFLEKYAVRVGGGFNHRFSQTDSWMIKDNHKTFFGGLTNALNFFKSLHSFYNPIIVEIHSLEELQEAINLKISHVMLDNFSPKDVKKAVDLKPSFMTYELSGGINIHNIEHYLFEGIDAISIGALTHNPPAVDISLKYTRA